MVFKYSLLFLVVAIGCIAAKSSNGEGCILKTEGSPDEYGMCTSFADCSYAKGESCRGHAPQICPSYDEDDSVCCRSVNECPPLLPGLVTIPKTGYRAWDYCVSIVELANPCKEMGDSWSRDDFCPAQSESASGDDVKPGDFPHLVLLSTVADNWSSASAGTLISSTWVLTSGYVVEKEKPKFAKVGALAATGGSTLDIEESVSYPGYKITSSYDDIGLIKVKEIKTFSKNILPACLHTGNVLPEETLKDIVKGYKNRDVELFPHADCSKDYEEMETVVADGVRESTQFCVKQTSGTALQDGIDGAPLQVYNGASVACTQSIFGVYTSSAGNTQLTTRVAAYITWIEDKVWPTVPETSKTKRFDSFIQSIFKK